jgi:hypothetical protein
MQVVAFPKRRYPRTRLDGVITHATVMKRLLPLKHMILYGNQRSSGYRGLFSQGIGRPECEAGRLPPAGTDVSNPAPYIGCTLQLSLTETLHYRCLHRCFRWVSSVATPHSELARTNIAVDRAAILFFIWGSRFKISTRTSAILVDFDGFS